MIGPVPEEGSFEPRHQNKSCSEQRCPSLNFLLEPEPSFFGFVFLGEPELELFGFPFLGGARARAFLVFSFLGSWSRS